MMKYHKSIILVCLDAKMKAAGATNLALAEASGVNSNSIALSRSKGRAMLLSNGLAVYEALNTRKFQYSKRGPKC
jgi:hypothetical protein